MRPTFTSPTGSCKVCVQPALHRIWAADHRGMAMWPVLLCGKHMSEYEQVLPGTEEELLAEWARHE